MDKGHGTADASEAVKQAVSDQRGGAPYSHPPQDGQRSDLAAPDSLGVAKRIYGIAHRTMNRKYKIAAIVEVLEALRTDDAVAMNSEAPQILREKPGPKGEL
jgi:hypothetical protein